MTAQKSVIPMNEHGRAITQEDIKPTVLPDAYLTSSIASALVDFKMPRFEDLPTVGLYRDQVIGIVEQTLSPLGTFQAIATLFKIQRVSYMVDVAFDYVAVQLENAVRSAFSIDATPQPDSATHVTRESLLVRNAVTAFAAKAYLLGYLHYIGYEGSE